MRPRTVPAMRTRAAPATHAPLAAVVLLASLLANERLASAETLATLGAILPPFLRTNFEEFVKTASNSCEVLPLELLYSRQYTAELPLIEVVEFSASGRRKLRLSRAHKTIEYRPPYPLVLYIPGWWNTPTDESSEALVNALLNKHPSVLVLDTRLCFCRGYIASASRVNPLANLIFEFIKNLNKKGVPLSSIHIIGFSLGAHVAGITGKLVQKRLSGKIGRITALDPAKPCFGRADFRLGRRDAKFVQVVHSSAGVLGLEQPVGHVDIYVNGVLVKQPECLDRGITIECDHAQAWRLYAASVMDEGALTGRQCGNWDELMRADCQGNLTALGFSCSDNSRGMFLYKSETQTKRNEVKVQAFNPFDFRTWWQ
ncbi:lipase member I-like [Ostrinia furnacalis]|uniref:lipase member I-like n=1 Tax=Ostrinia furnacalis TaxID=93504 RepID=UPI0010408C6B|nr:lipase member I-like [Ostrinia furnacalis]